MNGLAFRSHVCATHCFHLLKSKLFLVISITEPELKFAFLISVHRTFCCPLKLDFSETKME